MNSTTDDTLWRNYAKVYDGLLKVIPYRNLLLTVADTAAITNEMNVLDACCGTGNLLWALGQMNIACQVTGADFSKDMLAKAAPKAEKYAGSATLVEANLDEPAETWGLTGPFDRVIFNNSMCLIKEPKQVLKKVSAITTDDAIVVISTPRPNPSVDEVLDEHLAQAASEGRSREQALQQLLSILQPILECNAAMFERYGDNYHLPTRSQLPDWFEGTGWKITSIGLAYAGQNWLITAAKDAA